jgi:hypothetical protein
MFKVLDLETNEFRTTLDYSTRDEQEAVFRVAGRKGRLRCPHCRAQAILKCADICTPHFAHKALGDCPYGSESMEMLLARAALYLFLKKHFGTAVRIEHVLPVDEMPRPVDCWVQRKGKPFAYWLMEKGMRGTDRLDDLHSRITSTRAAVQFVFLSQILRKVKDERDVYHLTPTEEHLMLRSKYDSIYGDHVYSAGSLHYLGADEQCPEVTTLRSLRYKACGRHYSTSYRLRTEMTTLIVDADRGEFVHPGEDALLSDHLREAREMERQRQATRRRPWLEALARVRTRAAQENRLPPMGWLKAAPERPPVERAGRCERCGIVTTKWVSYDGRTGLCKCNDCCRSDRRKGEAHSSG